MLLKVDRCVIALSQCDGAVQGDTSASPLRLIHAYNMESRISRACCPLNGPRPPAGSRRKNASGWIKESWWSRNELRPQKPRVPTASQRGCRDEIQPFSRGSCLKPESKLITSNIRFLACNGRRLRGEGPLLCRSLVVHQQADPANGLPNCWPSSPRDYRQHPTDSPTHPQAPPPLCV
jgi:hypothetical protein